jgi:hypothetical protein
VQRLECKVGRHVNMEMTHCGGSIKRCAEFNCPRKTLIQAYSECPPKRRVNLHILDMCLGCHRGHGISGGYNWQCLKVLACECKTIHYMGNRRLFEFLSGTEARVMKMMKFPLSELSPWIRELRGNCWDNPTWPGSF